ncbi:MAG: hypothetical protein J3Q66DRAFT_22327 [Benniella sp.]|nr:MAG: hypothetical protein J3Q66DRAFT_22327 [Benniella sp.]
MKVFSLAAALLALTALVSAQEIDKRLVDISETELEVKEIHKPDLDTFVVSVQRTDDLLADDGTFLAERIMSVAFNFDVQDHEVFINKKPLSLGQDDSEDPISVTMTVEAAVLVGPALDPETKVDDLMNAFDTGLVTVQVTATSQFATLDDGTVVRRVTLQETIVEVNGHEIVQTDAAQQVLEIMPDGSLGSYTPLTFGKNGCRKNFHDAVNKAKEWIHSLNWPAFIGVGVVALAMVVLSATSLRALIKKRREARYARIHQNEVSDDFVQVTVVDDKKTLN